MKLNAAAHGARPFSAQLASGRLASGLSLIVALAMMLWTAQAAFAHEGRHVGEYNLNVGFADEPAFEGQRNGVQLRVTKSAGHRHDEEHEGEEATEEVTEEAAEEATEETAEEAAGEETGEEAADHDHDHAAEEASAPVPVEGLAETLQVEVTHIPSGVSKVMGLRAVFNDPGHYTNDWIPTAPGAYRFRFFGTIEGVEIDETFESGEGTFSDVEPATELYFPEPLPQMREVSGAARGAQETANSALESVVQVESRVSSASTMATAGLVAGVLGLLVGGGALFSNRRR